MAYLKRVFSLQVLGWSIATVLILLSVVPSVDSEFAFSCREYSVLFATFFIVILFFACLIRGLVTKDIKLIMGTFLVPTWIGIIYYCIHYHRIQCDGKRIEVGSLLFGENTHYPSGFSHKAFRQLKAGMSVNEMIEKIGYPFNIGNYRNWKGNANDTLYYYYFFDGEGTNHRTKTVLVARGGIVEVVNSFWWDWD
jgi:hypothetical protein